MPDKYNGWYRRFVNVMNWFESSIRLQILVLTDPLRGWMHPLGMAYRISIVAMPPSDMRKIGGAIPSCGTMRNLIQELACLKLLMKMN